MATIIVPAHNEEAVIKNCVDSLLKQKNFSDYIHKIIIACNGCMDNTVEISKQYANKYSVITCLDIQKPSKVNALNEAEKYADSFPVFYIDADTRLSQNAVATIVQFLKKETYLLVAPTPQIDTSDASWLVKKYYQTWLDLPYIRDGVVATCSYIITKKGRERFKKFPDIINDDGYVRCLFTSQERANIPNTFIYITAPKNIYSLIKIKTRARLGNMELQQTKQCPKQENKPYTNIMRKRLLQKGKSLSTFVYLAIAIIIRIRSRLQMKNLATYEWEKDLSSR